jgi:exodeoxyribonuclease VII large subunit
VGPAATRVLERADDGLTARAARAAVHDPAAALARGWSITRTAEGRLVRSVTDVAPGTALVTTVADGTIGSTVQDTKPTQDRSHQEDP